MVAFTEICILKSAHLQYGAERIEESTEGLKDSFPLLPFSLNFPLFLLFRTSPFHIFSQYVTG
jgi:hypothetical protein